MNKLLVALCIILSGVAVSSSASVHVVVSEDVFDEIVERHAISDPHVTVVIDEYNPSTRRYITYHDGFYYTFRKPGARKAFANPKVKVVPAVGVTEPD